MPETRLITSKDYEAWDGYVFLRSKTGPYLTTAWKDAVEKAYGHKTFYLARYENKDVVGVLPLVEVKPPMKKGVLVSLPFCDYGGVVTTSQNGAEELLHGALSLAREMKLYIEVRSSEACLPIEERSGAAQVTDKCRMVLELPGSSADLWSGFKSKLRSQVRKAGKEGLVPSLGGMELLDDFYRVFSRNMRDLGSPVHSEKWLKHIVSAFGDRALIGVVYKNVFPIGAGLMLMHNKMVTVPWASTLKEFNRLSPNMMLYWTFLEYAADREYDFFDFGRSTPGEGTYAFKKQWGARPEPLYWYRFNEASEKGVSGALNMNWRKTMEKVWQRFPLSVANSVGPYLRKYIDK